MSLDFKHEFESLTELGKEIGLEGDTLREFVIEERNKLKEERDKERDARAAEREREKQIRALELEEKRLEQEKEILEVRQKHEREENEARLKHEKEENEARRQHEKEMSEAQAKEAARADQSSMIELDKEEKTFVLQAKIADRTLEAAKLEHVIPSGHEQSSKSKYKPLKLPKYDESKDDMDAYINRFERYATANDWDEEVWALNLSTLLTGQGLQVYDSLTPADADYYPSLKRALLRRYKHTEEGYREKFKQAKPEVTESAEQFVTCIRRYLLRWVELAESGNSVDELIDLLTRDQFLHSCPKKMASHIIERDPKTTDALSKLADQYIKAHGGWYEKGIVNQVKSNQPKFNTNQNKPNTGKPNNQRTMQREPITCFICNRKGHTAKDCFRKGTLAMVLNSAETAHQPDENRPTVTENPGNYTTDGQQVSYHEYRPSSSSMSTSTAGAVHHTSHQPHADDKYHSLRSDIGLYHRPNQFQSQNSSNAQSNNSSWQQGNTGHISLGLLCSGFDPYKVDLNLGQHSSQVDCGCQREFLGAACKHWDHKRMPLNEGIVDGKVVNVYRDTGCSGVVVRESLVKPDQYTGQIHTCFLIDGTERKYPVAIINISSPYLNGNVYALVMKTPICDLVIGQHPGVQDSANKVTSTESVGTQADLDSEPIIVAAVETRAQKAARLKPFKSLLVTPPDEEITPESFRQAQQEDPTLEKIRERAETGERKEFKSGKVEMFSVQDGIIFREYLTPDSEYIDDLKQLVVPMKFRKHVLKLAHEALLGGHQGIQKTTDKVLTNFYWPGVGSDVNRHCQSCDICQRTVPKGRVSKVPLGEMPLIESPFERIAMDLIGPIKPVSERGHRYILVIIDYATRHPEAIPLKTIEAEVIAEELMKIYSRLGIPKEVLTDQGSQFVSKVMKEVNRLLSIRGITTTPYHAMTNGLCEKYNGTLKIMLKRMCEERPKDWDRYIPPLLFAYREVPQASTGFSPFELLFG